MPPLTFPPTFILKTRFVTREEQDELHRIESEIKPNLKFAVREARIVLGKVNRVERAKHDLRSLGLHSEEISGGTKKGGESVAHDGKRRRTMKGKGKGKGKEVVTIDSGSEAETSDESDSGNEVGRKRKRSPNHSRENSPASSDAPFGDVPDGTIKVLNIKWYYDSVKAGKLLPMEPPYLIYHCRIMSSPKTSKERTTPAKTPNSILSRAREDTLPPATRRYHQRTSHSSQTTSPSQHRHSQLHHEDTTDHETSTSMPPIPEYLKSRWSCERPTPMHCPNDDFIEQLKTIRHARELESNEQHHAFSAKAYSAGIAVIQAYPHRITSVRELLRLPGCGEKIARNWQEWHDTGSITEVIEIENDERLRALNLFWNIHQVADVTARKFYDQYGWKDLDDLVEHGWNTLNRDQQIGLKYYEELNLRIPRAEVEATEEIILSHANKIHPGFKICTVGGYRRGKETSGDMDFILSHPEMSVTHNFIGHLLDALSEAGWLKHELTVSFRNSERGQETLAWRGLDGKRRSVGFDTLDHAFVVWQNPSPPKEEGQTRPHRRVDIIISPWKTAGCAVLGWTGGKLFEQHLRSWVKEKKGWKFDSSGVRSRGSGRWMDLESRQEDEGREGAVTLEEKEKRVFEGLGLGYLEPTMRCTN